MGHPFYVVTINLKVKEVKEENEELQIEENRTAIYMQMDNALAKHPQTCGKVCNPSSYSENISHLSCI